MICFLFLEELLPIALFFYTADKAAVTNDKNVFMQECIEEDDHDTRSTMLNHNPSHFRGHGGGMPDPSLASTIEPSNHKKSADDTSHYY